jgi:hypothetical protein
MLPEAPRSARFERIAHEVSEPQRPSAEDTLVHPILRARPTVDARRATGPSRTLTRSLGGWPLNRRSAVHRSGLVWLLDHSSHRLHGFFVETSSSLHGADRRLHSLWRSKCSGSSRSSRAPRELFCVSVKPFPVPVSSGMTMPRRWSSWRAAGSDRRCHKAVRARRAVQARAARP